MSVSLLNFSSCVISILIHNFKFLLQFIEKALEECGNDFVSATKFLLNQHAESAECNVNLEYQSPVGMATGNQVPTEGKLLTYIRFI